MTRASATVVAREAFRAVSEMRGRARDMRVGFDRAVDLLAVSVDVIVMVISAWIERQRATQRTHNKPETEQY